MFKKFWKNYKAATDAKKSFEDRYTLFDAKIIKISAFTIVPLILALAAFGQGNFKKGLDTFFGDGTSRNIEKFTGKEIPNNGKKYPWDYD